MTTEFTQPLIYYEYKLKISFPVFANTTKREVSERNKNLSGTYVLLLRNN